MTAAAWGAMELAGLGGLAPGGKAQAWAALAAATVVGGGVYLAAAKLLRLEEFFDIVHRRKA